MDITVVDTDAPSQSNSQSKSDADLSRYLATSNTSSLSASPLPWHAADDNYGYGHNSLGLYDAPNDPGYGWSEQEANKYIVADHPLVDHEMELSDHSHTTDSGSRESSNPYSDSTFVRYGETWQNSSTYGPHGQETLLPPLPPGSPGPRDLHLPESHLTMYPPSPPYGSPFLGSSGINILPHLRDSPQDSRILLHGLLLDHPSPLSSTSSSHPPSSNEERCVSLKQLTAPYLSPKGGAGMKTASSSDDTPVKNSGRLTRLGDGKSTRGGRGGARGGRGGRRKGSAIPRRDPELKEAPLATGSRLKRRRPSYTSSDSSTVSEVSIPLPKRPKRNAVSKVANTFTDSESADDSGDAYLPSKSPSPYASQSDSARSSSPEYAPSKPKKRGSAKGTDVLKMTAAEALAKLTAEKANAENEDSDGQQYQPYHKFDTEKRKNGTIPLPVPVPHLTKKSRGRKVPYIDARMARPVLSEDEYDTGTSRSRGTPARRGRGGNRGAGGARSFVCAVPGCGKGFVRGEHLKRHVRSIHTHEKRKFDLFLCLHYLF